MNRSRPRARGQATVEFALVLPLFVACTAIVVAATLVGLRALALSDLARDAARAATVADVPCEAAAAVVEDRATLRCELGPLASGGATTVRITVTERVPMIGAVGDWLDALMPQATVTMLIEPPPVLR